MNILYLTKYPVNKGGVGKVILALASRMKKYGHNITVYSSHKENIQPEANKFKYIYGELPSPNFKIFDKCQKVKAIIKTCKDNNIDIIHCHGAYRAGYAAYLVKKYTSIPYIITSHGDLHIASSRSNKRTFKKRIEKILHYSDFITHLSSEMKVYTDCYIKKEKNEIIKNGINLQRWGVPAANLTGNYLLYVGRLEKEKGVHILLDSYKDISKKHKIPLVILGDGKEKENLIIHAKKAGLTVKKNLEDSVNFDSEYIYFLGWTDEEKLIKYYKNAKLVIVPSQFESFGLILLESMAVGKALVVSNLPVFKEILTQGRNAEFVETNNPNNWTEKIELLIEDENLRMKYENNNKEDVKSFDWDIIINQYIDVYNNVRESGIKRP